MAVIIHLMGPTCAGKSTIIDKLLSLSDDFAAVQIGKLLRKKYGEAYFNGQAAPEHTRDEALNLYFETTKQYIADGKKAILIDGQPRDLSQAKVMIDAWPDHHAFFLLVHASHEDREARAKAGRAPGPDLDLAIARLTNDYKNCYVVMTELIAQGIEINVVDTSAADFDTNDWCEKIVDAVKAES